MRTICGTILAAAMVAAAELAAGAQADTAAMCATSPDGRVKCVFSFEDGLPVADVSFCGRHAFRTELGMG